MAVKSKKKIKKPAKTAAKSKKKTVTKKAPAKKARPAKVKTPAFRVEKGKVITLHYSVRDESKKIVETSRGEEPLVYLHGAGEIIRGLEKGLKGQSVGKKLTVKVGPKDGYGAYDKGLVMKVGREKLSGKKNLQIGDIFRFGESDEDGRFLRVTELGKEIVTLDGNHPFAGKTLVFDIEILEIREATSIELEHNHAHPHGFEH